MESSADTAWQPIWTTQVRIESGGRYPLGLNRFHNGLEEILIKGITDTARRLRYISYCCWAIGDIEKNEKCNNYADFVNAFTLRENSLAMGLYLMKPTYGFYGSESMKKFVKDEKQQYNLAFKLMQSHNLGAFGLNYVGTTYNWGLTETNEKRIINLTRKGKEIYEIIDGYFNQSPPEYYKRYKGKKIVPTDVLLQWGKVNDFDNIRLPAHKKEREFYKSIIFRLEKGKVLDYRRDTFAFFLECIKYCSRSNTTFKEDVLRNIHYYSMYYDNKGVLCKFELKYHFRDLDFYWSVYEGHVYFRLWLSKFFQVFLNHLKASDNGSTIDEFFGEIAPKEFNVVINKFSASQRDFFNATMGDIISLFPQTHRLQDKISEEMVTKDKKYKSIAGILAKFALVMAGIYIKFKGIRSDKRYQYITAHLSNDLWFETLFKIRGFEKLMVKDFLEFTLKQYILHQHDSILIKKRDLRRYWFTKENNRYYHQVDTSVIKRPAKYQTIMNFLYDMKLIVQTESSVTLSNEGKTFFNNLINIYY